MTANLRSSFDMRTRSEQVTSLENNSSKQNVITVHSAIFSVYYQYIQIFWISMSRDVCIVNVNNCFNGRKTNVFNLYYKSFLFFLKKKKKLFFLIHFFNNFHLLIQTTYSSVFRTLYCNTTDASFVSNHGKFFLNHLPFRS